MPARAGRCNLVCPEPGNPVQVLNSSNKLLTLGLSGSGSNDMRPIVRAESHFALPGASSCLLDTDAFPKLWQHKNQSY